MNRNRNRCRSKRNGRPGIAIAIPHPLNRNPNFDLCVACVAGEMDPFVDYYASAVGRARRLTIVSECGLLVLAIAIADVGFISRD